MTAHENVRNLLVLLCRTVNGKTYLGVSEEKEKAAQQYVEHQQAGDNVGLVEAR